MLDCLHIYLTNLPIAQLYSWYSWKNTHEASFFRRRNFG